MFARPAVYRGKRAQKKYTLADKRRARAAELAAKGKSKRAARQTKRADKAEAGAERAGKRYEARKQTRLKSGKPSMRCGTGPGRGRTTGKPGRRCGSGPGRKPSTRKAIGRTRRRIRRGAK